MKKLAILILLTSFGFLSSLMPQIWFASEVAHNEALTQPAACGLDNCAQVEADILRSTLRLHLQVWRVKADESGYDVDESIGHATLRDGRYLVTHNHYALLEQAGLPDNSISVALFDSNGRYLFSLPLIDFNVTLEADETLVFEMKSDYMVAQLAAAGIQSATFADWRSLQLQAGMQVAQVDWDGLVSRVDWPTVVEVITEEDVPRLVLDDGVTVGSSGGGIFWNGVHIANTWRMIEYLDSAGNITNATSVAPLNEY